MTLALAIFIALAAGWDAFLTARRLRSFGPNVELNPLVRKLAQRFNPVLTTLLGVVLPTGVLVALLTLWLPGLAFYAGMRAQLALAQVLSIRSEKRLKLFFDGLPS